MNINELEELAKAATPGIWSIRASGSNFGTNYSVCVRKKNGWVNALKGNRFHGSDTRVTPEEANANIHHIAASNPPAILELIAAYQEAVAALRSVIDWDIRREYIVPYSVRDPIHRTLDTAKRLGVE